LKDAAGKGKFISKEDLQAHSKIGKSAIDKLSELGILDGMPDTNQLTFDFV